MDMTKAEVAALALQLRKPEGAMAQQVGEAMAQFNAGAIAFTMNCLDLRPRDHVLEIGFGPGEAIAEAVRLTPEGYVAGIDHSEDMLQMAEQRNHRAVMQEHVELTLGTAAELPYEDESFDVVFAINVFHFWPNPTRELAECHRVLKPGGQVVFFLTHPSSWLPGIAETGVFTPREAKDVERLLVSAGFKDIDSRSVETQPDGKGYVVIGKT